MIPSSQTSSKKDMEFEYAKLPGLFLTSFGGASVSFLTVSITCCTIHTLLNFFASLD